MEVWYRVCLYTDTFSLCRNKERLYTSDSERILRINQKIFSGKFCKFVFSDYICSDLLTYKITTK